MFANITDKLSYKATPNIWKKPIFRTFSHAIFHIFLSEDSLLGPSAGILLRKSTQNNQTYCFMRTRFWVTLIIVATCLSALSLWVDAQQEDTRQQRREERHQMSAERRAERIKRREERTAAFIKQIDSIVLSRNFVFNPTSMQRLPAGQFLTLNNPTFEVAYRSDYIDVHIPFIKGITPPYYPVVFNYILPSVSNYTTIQQEGGWTVTFSSWLYGGSDYIFTLDIYSASGSAVLTIKSMIDNTVTYSGYISPIY